MRCRAAFLHRSVRTVICCAGLFGVVVACYSPFVRVGTPCDNSDQCPTSQRCVLHHCALGDTLEVDAGPADVPDAAIDAPAPPIDTRLACSTAGLSCNGIATTFTCGGNCWLQCTESVPRNTARAACTGWMGELGKIDDAAEQSCVTVVVARLGVTAWLGLTQNDAATTPTTGWTWNDATPIVFPNWGPDRPDDGDHIESRSEQCGTIRITGMWDDEPCSTPLAFACERP